MKLIIAEKPSVAKDIAKVLQINSKEKGYIYNDQYAVTWAFGHLVSLYKPKYYQEDLTLSNLPVIPEQHVLKIGDDSGIKKQMNVIKKLLKECSSVICATDAGREGELIFRHIYNILGCSKPIERLWISSLTKKAIMEGFDNLKPGHDYDNLYFAAKARQESDWLVGLNSSIALTKSNGSGDLLSIGRVQTPTLAIVVKRFLQHKNFVPEDYFQVLMEIEKENQVYQTLYETNFKTEQEANDLLQGLHQEAKVDSIKVKEITEKPPTLFDLTLLQRKANSIFGFSAAETLKIAQSLYETHKVLTYPRTDSNFLSDDMRTSVFKTFEKLKTLSEYPDQIDEIIALQLGAPFNDKKVTDHHAIIPTGVTPGDLSDKESKIFNLVYQQFCKAFYKPCIKQSTQVIFSNNGHHDFNLKGILIKESGWRIFNGAASDNKDQLLPEFQENEMVKVTNSEILKKQTKPLPLLNENSLLGLMETAGKEVEDPELKNAMKEKGLGTPATRASIIETLLRRNYIIREKKQLIPSSLGINIIKLVKNTKIVSPSMTGEWEYKLRQMELGNLSPDLFDKEIKEYTREITKDMITAGKSLQFNSNNSLPDCPKCKKGKIKPNKVKFGCTRWNDETNPCDFGIWRSICDKVLTGNQVVQLLTKRKTGIIKGFYSQKSEKNFDAALILKDDFTVGFEFPKNGKSKTGKRKKKFSKK